MIVCIRYEVFFFQGSLTLVDIVLFSWAKNKLSTCNGICSGVLSNMMGRDWIKSSGGSNCLTNLEVLQGLPEGSPHS